MNKVIVNFTPTGMLMRKHDTPHIPVTCDEIVDDIQKACEIGISSVHLHARNPKTEDPVWEKEYYEEIITRVRDFAPDLVISVSTSGRVFNKFEFRSDVLKLTGKCKPDMASLTLSSLNFNKVASVNDPEMVSNLASCMKESGIKPELEVFDLGMINYAKYLIKKGLLEPPYYFNIILGNIATAQSNLLHTGVMLNDIPEDSVACLGAIGNFQLPTNSLAIVTGMDGIRVGLEDNIWFDEQRTKLATNSDLLERIKTLSTTVGREICTPAELRKMLHLPSLLEQ